MAESGNKSVEVGPQANTAKKDKVPLEEMSREDLLNHNKRLRQLLQTTKRNHDAMREKYAELEKMHNDDVQILEKLKAENEVESNEELYARVQKLQSKVEHMQKHEELLNEIKVLADARDSSLQLLKEVKESHENQIEEMKKQQSELEKAYLKIKEEFEDMKLQHSSMHNDFKILEKAKADLERKYSNECEEKTLLKDEISTLIVELSAAKEKIIEVEESRDSINQLLHNSNEEVREMCVSVYKLQNEVEICSEDLAKCKEEKNDVIKHVTEIEGDLKKILHCNADVENVSSITDMLKILSEEYEGMKIKLKNCEVDLENSKREMSAETSALELTSKGLKNEVTSLTNEIETLSEEINRLKSDTAKLTDTFEEEKSKLTSEVSVAVKGQELALKEVESLKEQLEEYERELSDSQKSINFETENIELKKYIKELEDGKYEISEQFEDKCIELSEIHNHLESLMVTITEGVKYKEFSQAFVAESDTMQNLFNLTMLCEDMVSQLKICSEHIANLQNELENTLRSKQNISNELTEALHLNQFLEDEVKSLRGEEVQQPKPKVNEVTDALLDISLDDCTVADAKSISGKIQSTRNDAYVQTTLASTSVSTQNSVLLSDSAVQADRSDELSKHEERKNSLSDAYSSLVTEWGYADEGSESTFGPSDKKIASLSEENKKLRSELECKSNLLSECHVRFDSQLSKVEALTAELDYKNSEVKALRYKIENLQKRVKHIQSLGDDMKRIMRNVSCLRSSVKELKDATGQSMKELRSSYQETVATTLENIYDIESKYVNCYAAFNICKDKNENSEARKITFNAVLNALSKDIAGLFMVISQNQDACGKQDMLAASHTDRIPEMPVPIDSVSVALDDNMQCILSNLNKFKSELQNYVQRSYKYEAKSKTSLEELSEYKNKAVLPLTKQAECLETKINKQSLAYEQCSSSAEELKVEAVKLDTCPSCEKIKKQLSETEGKMAKFKTVVVKKLTESKQQCKDRQAKNEVLEKRCNDLSVDCEKISDTHSQYVKNFQNLQSEYDKKQDEIENLKSLNKNLQSDFSATLQDLNNCKEKIVDLESVVKKAESQLEASETEKLSMKNKVTDLEGKIIILQAKNSDAQSKIQALTEDVKKGQIRVDEVEKEKILLKQQLEDALKEGNKNSLLDLEMADYERTISELTDQLESKNSEVAELKSEIEDHVSKIQSLQEEKRFCENTLKTEEARIESFREALENVKKELVTAREEEIELKENTAKLNLNVERLGLLEVDYKSQISRQSAELEQLKEMIKSSSENHQRIVHNLNSKISVQKQEILMAHKEVESMKQDFENYKIRVHNVLKQQKSSSTFSVTDGEVNKKLETQNEKLKLQLKDLSDKVHALTLENESLHEEHENLKQYHTSVLGELEAKDHNWSNRLELANIEKEKFQVMLQEMAKDHASQNEKLETSYKKQINLLQEECERNIGKLKKELEAADKQIAHLQREQQQASINNNSIVLGISTQEDPYIFDFLSQERQEGEGSECTDEGHVRLQHLSLSTIPSSGFIPLEKLVQSPVEPSTPTSLFSTHESEKFSTELASSKKKMEHMSEILNESEANNLRLSDQVRTLKEEIRRLERNQQRKEHAENLEYLKNVFLKFTTLQPGSEKATLVPVLNTILRLSPEEHQQLKDIAGDSESSDTTTSGWGNYLHRWSGVI